ncbi:hypothetical protein [Curtobacterium sp. MCSS17_008]|uniref:hypothetical protein n=1 Tax=Curtobacterium sp. MCSS17_008 TaxID=2175647 RepID=UPI0011B6D6E6|nr:hypothetical protein [Curtobacterium sp. MCSS17_008]
MTVQLVVESVVLDEQGAVTAVSGPYGTISAPTAVALVHFDAVTFIAGPVLATVRLLHRPAGLSLYCNWDGTARNNLRDLPPSVP